MSWGERSCSKEKAPLNEYGGCTAAEKQGCDVNCKYYTWDGKTPPDSQKINIIKPMMGYTSSGYPFKLKGRQ